MLSFQALTGGNALAPWGSVATTRSQLCSRCASPPSVVMLGLVFCGSCFESLSGVLRMRLTGEEMMRLLRGETLSQHARQIVVMVLSSIVGADSERLKKVLR